MRFFVIFKVILFGIVEGLTEWIPVSNTGHLAVLSHYLSFDAYEANAVFREMLVAGAAFGAACAAALLFLPGNTLMVQRIQKQRSISRERTAFWAVVTASFLPTALIGLFFSDEFAGFAFAPNSVRNLKMVVVAMITGGLFYLVSEFRIRRGAIRYEKTEEIPPRLIFIAGLTQMISFIPGSSRFGVLVLTLALFGVSRAACVSTAVFISIPSLFVSSLLPTLFYLFKLNGIEFSFVMTAALVSFFTSFFTLREIIRRLSKADLTKLGRYRIGFGVLLLLFCIL